MYGDPNCDPDQMAAMDDKTKAELRSLRRVKRAYYEFYKEQLRHTFLYGKPTEPVVVGLEDLDEELD